VSFSNRRLVKVSVSRIVYDETADVVRLEITPGTPSLQPSPGQYYFLYQPFRLTGWESHPFTIGAWSYEIGDQTSLVPTSDGRIKSLDTSHVPLLAGGASDRDYQCNSANGSSGQEESLKLKLTFWVRAYDGWTKQLRRQCLSSPAKTSETTILLEGPYGETFPLWRYESVLIIVGGTGIASAVPYIQDHLRRSVGDWDASPENEKTRVRDMELVWTTKQAAFIQDVARRELRHALKREDFSASFYATRDSTTYSEDPTDFGFEIQSSRPQLQSLIMSRACDACSAGTSLAILVCGPPRMADEARAATHLAMRQGHRSIKFVEESFTW
jgi:ferric-chelate reductase